MKKLLCLTSLFLFVVVSLFCQEDNKRVDISGIWARGPMVFTRFHEFSWDKQVHPRGGSSSCSLRNSLSSGKA